MAAKNARNRLIAEAAIVVVAVVGIWAIIYGPLLETCCGAADIAVVVVLWSASQIGGFLTGDVRDPGRVTVLIGLIIEALGVWAICRWAVWKLRKRKKDDV